MLVWLAMIPEFLESGLLPPGVDSAENWTEFVQRFGWNDHRKHLLEGLGFAIKELRGANCESLFIDGSFVTEKDYPSDYDACYETSGINFGRMNKVFADFSNQRALQKAFFRGEFFPCRFLVADTDPKRTFLDFFQVDKESGEKKGVVLLKLEDL